MTVRQLCRLIWSYTAHQGQKDTSRKPLLCLHLATTAGGYWRRGTLQVVTVIMRPLHNTSHSFPYSEKNNRLVHHDHKWDPINLVSALLKHPDNDLVICDPYVRNNEYTVPDSKHTLKRCISHCLFTLNSINKINIL